MNQLPTVAISSDFLEAFAKVPRPEQGKVMDFFSKFRANPQLPGLNLEKIKDTKARNLWSVRIDKAWRGIILRPDKGNVFVLLWVDHHDEAYAWARNRVCRVNPETGSIQVIDTSAVEEPAMSPPSGNGQQEAAPVELPPLFGGIRDKHLLRLGVPLELMPLTRAMKTEAELDSHASRYPQEAYEALSFLASGISLEEVFRSLEKEEEPTATVDPEDFVTALVHPDTQRRFHVLTDDLELMAMLSEPLAKWRVFLHPSQRALVQGRWKGPVRVLGGAGTGKTVVAMHRAKWLAEHVFTQEGDRILFTTFTRNLAADIKENLGKICSREVLRRIEVVNLDKWVSDFLHRQGYGYTIDYGEITRGLWEKAMTYAPAEPAWPATFFEEEWERVVQPLGLTTQTEYLKASRAGRGRRVNRKERLLIWPVFEEYRILMNDRQIREPEDAMREARALLAKRGSVLPYRAVIVDEAQDMSVQAFLLLRALLPSEIGPDALFIVGDAHQRIYRHKVVLSQCNIDIRGRGKRLKINYRTTDETRNWAVRIMEGLAVDDLDGGSDSNKGYKSLLHGATPVVKGFASLQEEVQFITDTCQEWEKDGHRLSEVCLVARTKTLVKEYHALLKEKGLTICLLPEREAEDVEAPGLRIATMHRVKGLEFSRIIIAGANAGTIPLETAAGPSDDHTVRQESETRERALLYVAATRAKGDVMVTFWGNPSPFLAHGFP